MAASWPAFVAPRRALSRSHQIEIPNPNVNASITNSQLPPHHIFVSHPSPPNRYDHGAPIGARHSKCTYSNPHGCAIVVSLGTKHAIRPNNLDCLHWKLTNILSTGEQKDFEVYSCHVSPDGSRLATAGGGTSTPSYSFKPNWPTHSAHVSWSCQADCPI